MQGVDAIAEVLRREGAEFLSVYVAQPLIDACGEVTGATRHNAAHIVLGNLAR